MRTLKTKNLKILWFLVQTPNNGKYPPGGKKTPLALAGSGARLFFTINSFFKTFFRAYVGAYFSKLEVIFCQEKLNQRSSK